MSASFQAQSSQARDIISPWPLYSQTVQKCASKGSWLSSSFLVGGRDFLADLASYMLYKKCFCAGFDGTKEYKTQRQRFKIARFEFLMTWFKVKTTERQFIRSRCQNWISPSRIRRRRAAMTAMITGQVKKFPLPKVKKLPPPKMKVLVVLQVRKLLLPMIKILPVPEV